MICALFLPLVIYNINLMQNLELLHFFWIFALKEMAKTEGEKPRFCTKSSKTEKKNP